MTSTHHHRTAQRRANNRLQVALIVLFAIALFTLFNMAVNAMSELTTEMDQTENVEIQVVESP